MSTRKIFLFLLPIALAYLILRLLLIMKLPPIWPDESIFAEIAYNILHHARPGADLWADAIPGVQQHILGYPPFFTYLLALWFKLTTFTIFFQRLLSIIFGLAYLISYFYLTKTYIKSKENYGLIFLPLLILVIDHTFLITSIMSRSEIFVLFFTNLSLILFYLAFLKENKKEVKSRKKIYLSALSGLAISIATLFHLIAALFLISESIMLVFLKKGQTFKDRLALIFGITALTPLIIFFISLIPYLRDYGFLINSLTNLRATSTNWISIIFNYQPIEEKVFAILLALSAICLTFISLIYRFKNLVIITVVTLVSWLIVLAGKIEWYYIYPIPFTYLGLILMIDNLQDKKSLIIRKILILICFIFILLNLKSIYSIKTLFQNDTYLYDDFADQILNYIPDNKTVFLSSLPDAYYVFKTKRNNKLLQFPPVPIALDKYINLLEQSDYIIYNAPLSASGLDQYLQKYAAKNIAKIYNVGGMDQYQAIIIELKPKQERKRI